MSLSHRAAAPADAQAIAELVAAHDSVHQAVSDEFSEQDVLGWCLVGTGAVRRRGDSYIADNFTHPDFRGVAWGATYDAAGREARRSRGGLGSLSRPLGLSESLLRGVGTTRSDRAAALLSRA